MEGTSPILNYTTLTPENIQKARRNKILSIIAIVLGCLSTLAAARLEIRNALAGSPMPYAPLPPGVHVKWREIPTSERSWRRWNFDTTVVLDWETRPLTPAQRADYERFRSKALADSALLDAIGTSCWLYPVVAFLLVTIPILLWKFRARRWRAALAVILVLQLLVIYSMYRLDYGEALSRATFD
jgi:hypothetical protein